MHGLGNDFVVIDAINQRLELTPEKTRQWADRHFGIGFDQLLLVEPPVSIDADFKYRIFNADGSEVFQCGNGARCFARFVRDKKLSEKQEIRVDTGFGQLRLHFDEDELITVNMGIPRHAPADIPLIAEQEAKFYSVMVNHSEKAFGAVSIGNPHAVMQVNDIKTASVAELGRELESHPMFPERANIGFMQVLDRQHIKLRVYERGAGETLACGSGACAAVVIGIEQNLLDHEVSVELPGGVLKINWSGRGEPVYMTGSAESVFDGRIPFANESASNDLTDAHVEHYLRQHPDFFNSHLGLLEQLSIPHPSGNAVSLIAKQLELVRSRYQEMEGQLTELIDIARENDAVVNRMHELTLALLDAGNLQEVIGNLETVLAEHFLTDFVVLRIIKDIPSSLHNVFVKPDSDTLKPFRKELSGNLPSCGRPTLEQARVLFGDVALELNSWAIVPLVFTELEGLLVIGSRDENRFRRGMGTLFLTQMGELVATRLLSLLQQR